MLTSALMQRQKMGRAISRPGSSKLDRRVKMKKNPSDRSESDILTSILVIKILSYVTGSRYMIYRGLFVTSWLSGYLAQVFVDTGANCNTISRSFFEQLIDRGLVSELVKGPETGVRINLVGGQTLGISGDKTIMEVDVATNME